MRGNLRVYLGRDNVRMSQYTAHAFDWHSFGQSQRSECMPRTMVRDLLLYTAFTDNFFQLLAHRPVVDFPEHGLVSRTVLVAFDYMHGNIKQFHLERDIGLVPLADYPFLAVHFHDFIRSQFLHVHKTKGGEAGEDEKVTHQCECGIFKLVCHDGLYLVFCQILPFLHVRADMELCKRVSRYQPVIMRPHHHSLQPHAVEPYRVEQKTDYDKLTLEVTTDGSISPKDALKEAAKILIYHFMLFSDEKITLESPDQESNQEFDEEVLHMRQLLKTRLVDMNLSVRALNCLKAADVETLGDLVQYNKTDLLKFRNFGKKSLSELDDLLESLNLSFGTDISKYKLDKEG